MQRIDPRIPMALVALAFVAALAGLARSWVAIENGAIESYAHAQSHAVAVVEHRIQARFNAIDASLTALQLAEQANEGSAVELMDDLGWGGLVDPDTRFVLYEGATVIADSQPLLDLPEGLDPSRRGWRVCETCPEAGWLGAAVPMPHGQTLVALLPLTALTPLLETGHAWVLGPDRTILAHADRTQVGTRPFEVDLDPRLEAMLVDMGAGRSGHRSYAWTDEGGTERYVAAFRPLSAAPPGWSLCISAPSSAATAPVARALRLLALVLAVLVVLVVLGSVATAGVLLAQRQRYAQEQRSEAERLSLTQAAAHAERLALLGTVTAGVAHDLRSPLATLKLSVDLLQEDQTDPETLQDILEAIDRLRLLSDDLTSFSRQNARDACLVPHAMQIACRLVRGSMPAGLSLRSELEHLPPVPISNQRLAQVLMNLLVNAVQAGATRVHVHGEDDGHQIVLQVEDDGPGLPGDLQTEAFKPFVTTKADGDGTGLGLYLCRRYVEEAGGSIRIGRGTLPGACFVVTLPHTGERTARELQVLVRGERELVTA